MFGQRNLTKAQKLQQLEVIYQMLLAVLSTGRFWTITNWIQFKCKPCQGGLKFHQVTKLDQTSLCYLNTRQSGRFFYYEMVALWCLPHRFSKLNTYHSKRRCPVYQSEILSNFYCYGVVERPHNNKQRKSDSAVVLLFCALRTTADNVSLMTVL